jgi:acyl-CoA thioester hydrolase
MKKEKIREFVEIEYRVPYADTDQMGVVYYGNYFTYFERIRNEYLREKGWTYKEIESEGIQLPVIETKSNYKLPAKYDDLLMIRGSCELIKPTRLIFHCQVFRGDELLTEGYTIHVCLDSKTGIIKKIPSKLRELMG